MMQQALVISHDDHDGWRFAAPQPLPLMRLLRGRTLNDALRLVPLLFNVCSAAQAMAVREAFGLVPEEELRAALKAERVREHQRKLWLELPARLGLRGEVAAQPLGLAGDDPAALEQWMAQAGVAGMALRRLLEWDERIGVAELPLIEEDVAPDWPQARQQGRAVENSLAALWQDHPLMQWIEARRGRGPAWRFLARLVDLSMLLRGEMRGRSAWAARGRLFARGELDGNLRVQRFERLAPTDFLLVEGGVLARVLDGLAPDAPEVPALVALADPCVPWRVESFHPEVESSGEMWSDA